MHFSSWKPLRSKFLRAAVALLACTGASAFAAANKSIVVATSVLSQHFDTTNLVSTADYLTGSMLYDGLINLGPNGMFPGLAESWAVSSDGKQIDFKLRKGVVFHNGDPFSAEDVKFTFERILAPDNAHSYRRGFVDSIERMEIVDPLQIRFVLKQPWPAFFTTARYALTYILPKAYFEKVGSKGFQEHPVGTGPFAFDGMKAGEWTKLAANPKYWAKPPQIGSVTMRLVAEDFTRYAMIERGEADIATSLTGALLEKARSNSRLRVIVSPYSGTSGILFNKKLFPEADDRRVRLAIALGINREAISEKILRGVCKPATGVFTPATFGYVDGLAPIPYDPAQAKTLLAQAGIKPGYKITFTLHTQAFAALPGSPQVLEAIAGNLENLGFSVERQSVDTDAWMSMMRGGKPPAVFYTPSGTPDDGGELINTWFVSTSSWTSRSVQVPEYDRIFREQQQTGDLERRKKLLNEFARLEHEKIEMVPLLWCDTPFVVSSRVKSWQPAVGSGYYMNLGGLELTD